MHDCASDPERDAKLAWANQVLTQHLVDIGDEFPGLPKRTVIVRDPAYDDRYILLTNEDDAIADALHAVIAGSAKEVSA